MPISSSTEIANLALIQLGQSRIINIDDATTERGRVMKERYDPARRAVLRSNRWNASIRRASITSALSAKPLWGFDFQYALPEGFLRFEDRQDNLTRWRIEHGEDGRVILSNDQPLNFTYVIDLIDTTKMDDGMIECIVKRLAADTALKLTGSSSDARLAEQLYAQTLAEYRYQDAQESPPTEIVNDVYVRARRIGSSALITDQATSSGQTGTSDDQVLIVTP